MHFNEQGLLETHEEVGDAVYLVDIQRFLERCHLPFAAASLVFVWDAFRPRMAERPPASSRSKRLGWTG